MSDASSRESGWEWPHAGGSLAVDPLRDRDPALAALEAAWRAGLLVENELAA